VLHGDPVPGGELLHAYQSAAGLWFRINLSLLDPGSGSRRAKTSYKI
jgi:hypothetical protein